MDEGCATLGQSQITTNQKDFTFDGSKGLFPSFPTKKMAEPNLVILVIFLVALGPEGGFWGDEWVMRHPRRVMW